MLKSNTIERFRNQFHAVFASKQSNENETKHETTSTWTAKKSKQMRRCKLKGKSKCFKMDWRNATYALRLHVQSGILPISTLVRWHRGKLATPCIEARQIFCQILFCVRPRPMLVRHRGWQVGIRHYRSRKVMLSLKSSIDLSRYISCLSVCDQLPIHANSLFLLKTKFNIFSVIKTIF